MILVILRAGEILSSLNCLLSVPPRLCQLWGLVVQIQKKTKLFSSFDLRHFPIAASHTCPCPILAYAFNSALFRELNA
jgi:hypothetical protein